MSSSGDQVGPETREPGNSAIAVRRGCDFDCEHVWVTIGYTLSMYGRTREQQECGKCHALGEVGRDRLQWWVPEAPERRNSSTEERPGAVAAPTPGGDYSG